MTNNADRVFFSDSPTLSDVRRLYGQSAAKAWLVAQLVNISEFCGARTKITDTQAIELAELICGEYFFLKLPEFMLFCRRFKSGRYRQFYGSVDPMAIMASVREFLAERNEAYFRHENEMNQRRAEEDSAAWQFIRQATDEYSMLSREQEQQIKKRE